MFFFKFKTDWGVVIMTKEKMYEIAVENYYRDVEEYTDRLISGDITEQRYRSLVIYARAFWLSIND